jgi:protein involved in polysaccharide export with SLBB domain
MNMATTMGGMFRKAALMGLVLFGGLVVASAIHAQDFSGGLTGMGSAAVADPARSEWQQRNAAVAEAAAGVPVSGGGNVRSDGAYTLGPGDKIRLNVFGEEELSGEFEVDGTGTLALPLMGQIQAGGKTSREVEMQITKTLSDGYLVNPRVSMEVMNFRPFFILGEVNKPGSYPYVNDMSVISAVALAGGYTPRAVVGKVYIKRASDPARKEVTVPEDAKVYPGDVIRVDERFF